MMCPSIQSFGVLTHHSVTTVALIISKCSSAPSTPSNIFMCRSVPTPLDVFVPGCGTHYATLLPIWRYSQCSFQDAGFYKISYYMLLKIQLITCAIAILQTTGEVMKIQITYEPRVLLDTLGGFYCVPR